MTSIAKDDIRAVASQIIGICRRLGDGWTALAVDMNADAAKRGEAAHNAARLSGVAAAMESITDDHVELSLKLAEAEAKLAAITKLLAEREPTTMAQLATNFEGTVLHMKLVTDIKAILS